MSSVNDSLTNSAGDSGRLQRSSKVQSSTTGIRPPSGYSPSAQSRPSVPSLMASQRAVSVQSDLESNLLSLGAVCITDLTMRKNGFVEIKKKSKIRAVPFKTRFAALRPTVLTYGDFKDVAALSAAISSATQSAVMAGDEVDEVEEDTPGNSSKTKIGDEKGPSLLRDFCIAPPDFLDIGNVGDNVIWLKLHRVQIDSDDTANSSKSKTSMKSKKSKKRTKSQSSDAVEGEVDGAVSGSKLVVDKLQTKLRQDMLLTDEKVEDKPLQLKLQFASTQVCQEWLDFIERESEQNYLKRLMVGLVSSSSPAAAVHSNAVPVNSPSVVALPSLTAEFLNKAYLCIWLLVLSDRQHNDYLRQVMVLPTDSAELQVAQHAVIRILVWIQRVLGNVSRLTGEHAHLFATLFSVAMSNLAFRALLFLVEPDERFTSDYLRAASTLMPTQKITEMERVDFDIFINQLTIVDNWQKYHFLSMVDHPMAPKLSHPTATWVGLTQVQQRIHAEELLWIQTKIPSTASPFTYEKFNVAKECDAFLAYYFLQQRFLVASSGPGRSLQSLSAKAVPQVTDKLKELPRVFFGQHFRGFQTTKLMADHFQLLADQCVFLKVWELVWRNDTVSKEFSQSVASKLWSEMANDCGVNCKDLRRMFLPRRFFRDISQCTFNTCLYGRIAHELATPGSQLSSSFSLVEVSLFDSVDLALNEVIVADSMDGSSKLAPVRPMKVVDFATKGQKFDLDDFPHLELKENHMVGLQLVFSRILQWMQALMFGKALSQFEKSDAMLFVNLFTTAVKSLSFRAVLTMFTPCQEMIDQFAQDVKEGVGAAEAALEEICSRFVSKFSCLQDYEKDPIFASFLYVAGHPTVTIANLHNPSLFLSQGASNTQVLKVNVNTVPNSTPRKRKSILDKVMIIGKRSPQSVVNDSVVTTVKDPERSAVELTINAVTTWSDEMRWMNCVVHHSISSHQSLWTLQWKELDLMLSNSPCMAFSVLQRFYNDAIVGDDYIVKMLNVLPMNVVTAHFEYCFDFESFLQSSLLTAATTKSSHFVSLLNVVRVRTVWKVLGTDKLEGNYDFSNAAQNELWTAMDLWKKGTHNLSASIAVFSPLKDSCNYNACSFREILPLCLTLHYPLLCKSLSDLAGCEKPSTNDNVVDFSQRLTELKSFIDYLLDWIVCLTGCTSTDELSQQHVGIFISLLDAALEEPLVRSILLLVKPSLESDVAMTVAGSGPEVLWLQLKSFVDDLGAVVKSYDDPQAYGYVLWLFGHPGVSCSESKGVCKFHIECIPWETEMNWIKLLRASVPQINLDSAGLKLLVENELALPFRLISAYLNEKGKFKGFHSMQPWPDAIAKLPKSLLHVKFETPLNYLSHGVHETAESANVVDGCHLLELLRFQLFLCVWRTYFSEASTEACSEIFVNTTIALIWQTMRRDESNSLRKFFYFASSLDDGDDAALALANVASASKPSQLVTLLQRVVRLRSYDDSLIQALFVALSIERPAAHEFGEDDLSSLNFLTKRLLAWTGALRGDKLRLDDSDASLFVELLARSVDDIAFRVFCATFMPSSSAVNDYQSSDLFLFQEDPAKAMIGFIADTLRGSHWQPNRVFLKLLDQKLAPFAGLSEEEDALWVNESVWLAKVFKTPVCMLSWRDIDAICRSGPAICFIIIMRVIPLDQRLFALEALSIDCLNSEFHLWKGDETPQLILGRHFLSLCAKEDATATTGRDSTLQTFMKLRIVTDGFLQELLRLSFENIKAPNFTGACAIVKRLLFEEGDVERAILREEILCMIPHAARSILQSLQDMIAYPGFCRDEADMCQLLSLAVLMEETSLYPALAHLVVPLSELESVAELSHVIDELNFSQWLATQCLQSAFFIESASPSYSNVVADADDITSFLARFRHKSSCHSKTFVARLTGCYFRVCLKRLPQHFKSFIDSIEADKRRFVTVLFNDNTLRTAMVDELAKVFALRKDEFLYCSLRDGLILYDNDHFAPDSMHALSLRQHSVVSNLAEADFGALLVVSMYLHDLTDLSSRLVKLVEWILRDIARSKLFTRFLWWMIDTFIAPDLLENRSSDASRKKWTRCSRFAQLTLEDFLHFSNHGIVLSKHKGVDLERDTVWRESLGKFFLETHCLTTVPNIARHQKRLTLGMVIYARTVLFFFKHLFSPISGEVYFSSSVTSSIASMASLDNDSIWERVVKPLYDILIDLKEWSAAECDLFSELSLHWLCLKRDDSALLIEPVPDQTSKHVQVMALMTCVNWARALFVRRDASLGSTLVLKAAHAMPISASSKNAFMAAMLAIYNVKILRKRVHIMFEDIVALDAEYELMTPVYRLFNILPRDGRDTEDDPDLCRTSLSTLSPEAYRNEFSNYGVTYCLAANVEQSVQLSLDHNTEPLLKNTVLILSGHLDALCSPNGASCTSSRPRNMFPMYFAPMIFAKYDCILAFCQSLDRNSFFVDDKTHSAFFNAEAYCDLSDDSSNTLTPVHQFLDRVHLGRRLHRLHNAYFTRYGHGIVFQAKEALLKAVLLDEKVKHTDVDAAFKRLDLVEDCSVLPPSHQSFVGRSTEHNDTALEIDLDGLDFTAGRSLGATWPSAFTGPVTGTNETAVDEFDDIQFGDVGVPYSHFPGGSGDHVDADNNPVFHFVNPASLNASSSRTLMQSEGDIIFPPPPPPVRSATPPLPLNATVDFSGIDVGLSFSHSLPNAPLLWSQPTPNASVSAAPTDTHKHSQKIVLKNLSQLSRQRVAAGQCEDCDSLQCLRVGETKVLRVPVSNDQQFALHAMLRDRDCQLCVGKLIDRSSNTVIDEVCIDAAVHSESSRVFIVALTLRFADDSLDRHFRTLSLYREKKLLRLKCRDMTLFEHPLHIIPSSNVMPFRSFAIHNVSTGEELGIAAEVSFSISCSVTGQEKHETVSFDGHGNIEFPASLRDVEGVLTVQVLAQRFHPRRMQFLYFGGAINDESTRVCVCPDDLLSDECRVVLTWRSAPSDLDLYARADCLEDVVQANSSEYPAIIRFEDSLNEEREGFGPESIVFTSSPDRKFRFYVNNFTTTEASLSVSGARMTVFASDGSVLEEIAVPEEVVFDSFGHQATYWHALDVVHGKVVVVNELVGDGQRFEHGCF